MRQRTRRSGPLPADNHSLAGVMVLPTRYDTCSQSSHGRHCLRDKASVPRFGVAGGKPGWRAVMPAQHRAMAAPLAGVAILDVFGKIVQFRHPGVERVGIDVQRAVSEKKAHDGSRLSWSQASGLTPVLAVDPVFSAEDAQHFDGTQCIWRNELLRPAVSAGTQGNSGGRHLDRTGHRGMTLAAEAVAARVAAVDLAFAHQAVAAMDAQRDAVFAGTHPAGGNRGFLRREVQCRVFGAAFEALYRKRPLPIAGAFAVAGRGGKHVDAA
ncbi:protein of unknown function [Cupriavidus taiwanensis]|uniref:Uncharacterized protein n=1 Tax=Cupriavidus taiwanensis TaxID=164546 RepID=A0A7Z7NPT9_9BURK|nr:protein of unknown function [Cupriavidus taiwanensis]